MKDYAVIFGQSVKGFAEGEGRGRVIYRRMPPLCLQSDAFIEALLGTAHGVYALTGVDGEVRVVQRNAGRGELEFGFAWRPRRASA